MKKLLIVLAVLMLTACDSSTDPLSVRELVVKDCKSTGQSFVNVEKKCFEPLMRGGCGKPLMDIPVQYYVYDCGGERKLSLFKLNYDKP